jgi:hypothetical protein
MASLISTLARVAFGSSPEVLCSADTWRDGIDELRRRSGGVRESGAFLLGRNGKRRVIEEFVFYDDIDPNSLSSGIVIIDGRNLGSLWKHCRETGRRVVADLHVHPAGCGYGQSESDMQNPIIAEVGHFAMIIPDYAARRREPGGIGIYEYRGARSWKDRSHERPSPVHIGWWPKWR